MATAQDEPVRTDDEIEEWAKVRVRTARIRIEPGYHARPGECLGMGIEDLKVKLRGEVIEDPDVIRLEREPQRAVHALLIDTSGSMFGRLDHARDAATEYVKRLRPGLDRAMVVTFDDSVVLVEGLTERVGLADAGCRACSSEAPGAQADRPAAQRQFCTPELASRPGGAVGQFPQEPTASALVGRSPRPSRGHTDPGFYR